MLLRSGDANDVWLGMSDDKVPAAKAEKAREDGLRGERAICSVREWLLLFIHVFNAKRHAEAKEVLEIKDPVVTSLGVFVPAVRSIGMPNQGPLFVSSTYAAYADPPEGG